MNQGLVNSFTRSEGLGPEESCPPTLEKLMQSVTDREMGAYIGKRRGMEIRVKEIREFSAPVSTEQK